MTHIKTWFHRGFELIKTRKVNDFKSLRLNYWNITQVTQKCKLLTSSSRILKCCLIQSYSLKRILGKFLGNSRILWKSICFCTDSWLKRLCSDPRICFREIKMKRKNLSYNLHHQERFFVMLHHSKNFRELNWAL